MDEHPSGIGPKGVLEEQARAPVVSAGSEFELKTSSTKEAGVGICPEAPPASFVDCSLAPVYHVRRWAARPIMRGKE
jgi:hypothetical protein